MNLDFKKYQFLFTPGPHICIYTQYSQYRVKSRLFCIRAHFYLLPALLHAYLYFGGWAIFRLGTVPGYVINRAFHAIHTHNGCDSWSSIPLPVVSLPGVIPRFAYSIF